MPIHDWTRVEPGIFHDFHHALIEQIKRELNGEILPSDYYALAEQFAGGLGPDVLTWNARPPAATDEDDEAPSSSTHGANRGVLLATPRVHPTAQTEMESYRRKQSLIAVRHVSGDRVVAVVEVISPGNRSSRHALEQFVRKAAEFLDRRVHLLIIDLLPPGRYDPQGIHTAIWDYIDARPWTPAPGKPLTVVAYESDLTIRAYVESLAVGDSLPPTPLFLEPGGCVEIPLEDCYRTAWSAVPRRWRDVLEPPV